VRENGYRPWRDSLYSSGFPGTYVPGYLVPPLRG